MNIYENYLKTSKTIVSFKEQFTNILKNVKTCVLCLREVTEDAVKIYDEIIVETSQNVIMHEIITFVMGYELQENEIGKQMCSVCRDCTISAVNCYNFMKMCRKSHSQIQSLVNNFSLINLDSVDESLGKSMYITMTNENFDINLIFDKFKGPKTSEKAAKRYRSIIGEFRRFKLKEIGDKTNNLYKCKECSKVFKWSNSLISHYDKVHAPKTFQCPQCPKKFGSELLQNLHLKSYHVTVMCPDCGEVFNNRKAWKSHKFTHQAQTCPKCGKQYKTKHNYDRHLKLEDCGEDMHLRFECERCNKQFTQKATLTAHIKFVHENGKAFTCSWCDKKFPAESLLKTHIVKHTGERNFTCELCKAKFGTKAALLYHTRIHTGEKPYPCPECDERFLSSSRRMDHLRRKHRPPSLECDICLTKFTSSHSLKKHRSRHFNSNSKLYHLD